jgi:hypothetical protein
MEEFPVVFQNEEAAKLLDYFVAYKKLMEKVEIARCAAAKGEISMPEVHADPPIGLHVGSAVNAGAEL